MTAPCPRCGSEMVSVADSVRSLFPTGYRCVNFFGPHTPRATYRCIDPSGVAFDCVDYPDAKERFWDMVQRTRMTGLFEMVRLTARTTFTGQVHVSVLHSIVVQAVDA